MTDIGPRPAAKLVGCISFITVLDIRAQPMEKNHPCGLVGNGSVGCRVELILAAQRLRLLGEQRTFLGNNRFPPFNHSSQ